MSTTFGIHKEGKVFGFDNDDDSVYDENDDFIKVAFRSSYIRWTNELGKLLNDDVQVIALDNSQQGIYTIGDIKREIKEQDEKNSN